MRGIMIAGTNSGCGKTTITLGILAALKKKGYKVQPFKAGPDYIDTGLHKLITGTTSRNLDLWMCGQDYVKGCFNKYAATADISVVEGVMGMYDGDRSTASLAAILNLPVLLVVDGYGMAESAGAVVRGFRDQGLEIGVKIAGVIFNRLGSERHYKRIEDSIRDIPVLGYLPRELEFKIPHRHLGLIVAEEEPIKSEEIDRLADTVLEYIDLDKIAQNADLKEQDNRLPNLSPAPCLLNPAVKIAVAYDRAFCFYYEDNFDLLREAGAEIVRFSPLSDRAVPDNIDALYFGGGYPELHAKELSGNSSMLDSVKNCSEKGIPVYAECGGFMYLTEGIYDLEGRFHEMAGIFPVRTGMLKGRPRIGYREITLNEDSPFGKKGSIMRGHEFHYSEITDKPSNPRILESLNPSMIYSVKDGSGNDLHDEGYRINNTTGSYIHIHFGSNESVAGNFINFIKEECAGAVSRGTARRTPTGFPS